MPIDLEALRAAKARKQQAQPGGGTLDLAGLRRAMGGGVAPDSLSAASVLRSDLFRAPRESIVAIADPTDLSAAALRPPSPVPAGPTITLNLPESVAGGFDRAEQPQLVPGPPRTLWAAAKQAIRERTGYFEPPIQSGPRERMEQPLRTLGQIGAYYTADYLNGLGLGIPDILASRVAPGQGLAETVNKLTGFRPTDREVSASEAQAFIGGLSTAGRIAKPLVQRIAARQALKGILAGGLTFGTRRAAEELADKIVRNDPVSLEGIYFESGVGVLFGAGEEGVRQFARFIQGIRAGKAIEISATPQGPVDSRVAARKEIDEALRKYRATGDRTDWDRVRTKYTGAPVPGQEQPAAGQPAPPSKPLVTPPAPESGGQPTAARALALPSQATPASAPTTAGLPGVSLPTATNPPASTAPGRDLVQIRTSIGTIAVPRDELTGEVQDDLERIFELGNIGEDLGVPQAGLQRSLSVGDTVEYGSNTYKVQSQGFTLAEQPRYASESKPPELADEAKNRRRNIIQNRVAQGENVGPRVLQEFSSEPWADEILGKTQTPATSTQQDPLIGFSWNEGKGQIWQVASTEGDRVTAVLVDGGPSETHAWPRSHVEMRFNEPRIPPPPGTPALTPAESRELEYRAESLFEKGLEAGSMFEGGEVSPNEGLAWRSMGPVELGKVLSGTSFGGGTARRGNWWSWFPSRAAANQGGKGKPKYLVEVRGAKVKGEALDNSRNLRNVTGMWRSEGQGWERVTVEQARAELTGQTAKTPPGGRVDVAGLRESIQQTGTAPAPKKPAQMTKAEFENQAQTEKDLAQTLGNLASEFVGVDPDWQPFEAIVPEKWREGFMFMGRVGDFNKGQPTTYDDIRTYKHGVTRRYLNIDPLGRTWKFEGGKYVPIPHKQAFDEAFAGIEGLMGKGGSPATRETPYDPEYIAQRTAALEKAGFKTIGVSPEGVEVSGEATTHRREIQKALASGELSPAEAVRLHQGDYPDIAQWPEYQAALPEPPLDASEVQAAAATVTDIVKLPVADIQVDPQRFQFKLEATRPGGVSEKLESVSKWNPKAAGTILVWKDNQGQHWVVDGHHRLALAKRLGVQDITAYVVSEANGVSAPAARVLGAMSNMADEKGTAIDAAKLFRDSNLSLADLQKEGVDTRTELVRQGMAMKSLSDEVFRMVIDGKVPANMAAKIAENVTSPVQQKQVADIVAGGGVETVREAELLARTIDSAPVLTKTEQTLFGTETTEKSLYAERAKLLANVEQHLKTHKKVFGVLSAKAGMIEQAGNVLAKEANIQAKQRADEILYLLEKLVNAKGAVSDALNAATKRYAENPTKQRLAEVTSDLLQQWESKLTLEGLGEIRSGLPEQGQQAGPVDLFGAEGPRPPETKPAEGGTPGRVDTEALRKAREERRRMGGFVRVPDLPDMARELVSVVRAVKDNPTELLAATWRMIRRNLRAGTTYMRTLGGGGRLTANDLDDITFQMTKKGNRDLADIRLVYKGLTKQQRELVAQIMNERVPQAGQSKTLLDRVTRLREILDRTMNEAAALGIPRLVRGQQIPMGGSGRAFPQVPNADGIEFLKAAKAEGKANARVFAWAQEQVKAGRYASIDDAIGALQDFRDRQLRGVNSYLERTRIELPMECVEWDGVKILPHVVERNWLTVEGIRKWGLDQDGQSFPRVRSRVERIRQEHGPQAADRVWNFIGTSFGLQSPASQEARTISNKIRAYQFTTKVALSPLTIVRNMTDRLAKGMMHSMVGTIEALAEYPPFINGFIRASQKIEDEMIRRGAVFSHTALSEGYEAGNVTAEMLRTPFMESERGNQVFEAVVAQHALMRDLAILERQRPGTLGRIADKVAFVFGHSKSQAAYRVGPRIMRKLKAGEPITDDDVSRFLHEAVSNQAFPMVLNSKPIWWDAHPVAKLFAQFRTWPLRQANMIWEDVFKYSVKTGDFTRLARFLLGVLVAGEIYNIARDLLFDRNESLTAQAFRPAQDRQIAHAIINDLLDGGVVGVLADFTYGVRDWIGGVTVKTAKNFATLVGNIKKTPGLSLPAIEKFMRQEVTPYRQVLAGLNKIDQQIDPKNISARHMKWRAAAYHWQKTQEKPGVLGAVEAYTDDVLFGQPEYPVGKDTLAYELAARQVAVGDIKDASKFLRYILENAENPAKAKEGLKRSMEAQSPLGPIPNKDLPRFLASLSPTERQAATKTNATFRSHYIEAIMLALKGFRPRPKPQTQQETEPQSPRAGRIDIAGLRQQLELSGSTSK